MEQEPDQNDNRSFADQVKVELHFHQQQFLQSFRPIFSVFFQKKINFNFISINAALARVFLTKIIF